MGYVGLPLAIAFAEKFQIVGYDIDKSRIQDLKIGHDKIVKKFRDDLSGRVVGFGTYDLQRPDNATHWVALTGKNREDHMMLYDKLQSNNEFTELIGERGNAEAVKDYVAEILKVNK